MYSKDNIYIISTDASKMPISIVTRAYRSSELKNLISNLSTNNELEFEVIAVCNIKDSDYDNIKIIVEDSNMFRARITGIRNAKSERLLLLDSDQIPEKGLLTELKTKIDDMVIIPERSLRHNVVGRFLDDWRFRNERRAFRHPRPEIPVIPRFYWKRQLIKVIENLPKNVFDNVSHEDSVLYHRVFTDSNDIGFTTKYILNDDPSLATLLRKSYKYGKYIKEAFDLELPNDIVDLITKLNKSSLSIGELGIGKGLILQLLRGFIYELGRKFG